MDERTSVQQFHMAKNLVALESITVALAAARRVQEPLYNLSVYVLNDVGSTFSRPLEQAEKQK